jgi:hypothetical protein
VSHAERKEARREDRDDDGHGHGNGKGRGHNKWPPRPHGA